MGWWSAAAQVVRELVGLPRPMTLDLQPLATFDTAPAPIDRLLASMRAPGDGGRTTREQALSIAAVQRGRNEICSIATLPLKLYRGLDVVDSALFRQFDVDVPNVVHMAATIEDLAFESIAWWQVTGQDFDGYPVSVRRVDPSWVTLKDPRSKAQSPGGIEQQGRYVWIDRQDGTGPLPFPSALMIRFDSPNPGILRVNGPAIRRAAALNRLAGMYADNPALREWFTDNPNATDIDPMKEDEVQAFLAEYGAMRQLRPFGWIPGNVTRSDVSSPSPRDLTLVELQKQVTLEIANGLGVDPEDLGVSTTSRTYFNSVDKKQDKINRVYAPFMSAITDRLMMGDVTRRGYAPKYDLTDYLKSAPTEQAAYWKALKDMDVTDPAEIRGWAGLSGPPPEAPAAAPPAAQGALPAATSAAAVRVPATVGRAFDGPGPAFTFHATDFATAAPDAPSVDVAARTITGLAVPYNAIANKYGMKYSFKPGSLEYSAPERMAHLKDHTTPVGFHRSVKDSPAGPVVELAVLDGPDGSPAKFERDQLLYDAQHGLYSGLSVGVDFSLDPADGDIEYDEETDTYNVVRATWRETSTTYMPAFDDARVTKVAASRTGGPTVDPCQHCGHKHAGNIACATFRAQLLGQQQPPAAPAAVPAPAGQFTMDAFLQALQQQNNNAAPAPVPADPGPTPVNPGHSPATVVEPLPYRYDRKGNLRAGSHDFSTDISMAYNPNYDGPEDRTAADKRIGAWLKYAFGDDDGQKHLGNLALPGDAAQQQFAITPTNVVNLNYPQNRPEMYVDQLDYLYPMYQAFSKGTLDTVTPFVLPKFNSSTGLVADHVTGTEPTPGAFTATSQTITPSALSGKVEITREVFDQGGNPQASGLIWRQMVRGWYEGIEAAIQAFFVANAASIPDIALGIAVTDAAMDQALASAITALQYIRGGDRYQKVFTQIDLYQKLAKAVDTTNRPLYPTFGAMNASGTAAESQAWLNVRGKTFVPAWATAATGTVAASSWMMDPDVVGVWLSTPQRLDLQWRVAWVDLGIWGYKALAITDFTRTRELVYDPV
jgi:hypothetical protein